MNILLTCAGRRNYLIQYFKNELNGRGKVIAADMQASAPALVVADKSFVVPSIYSSEYINSLLDICVNEKIELIISLNDLELPVLSIHREHFSMHGVRLLISSYEVIEICFDKWKTKLFASENGFLSPNTYLSLQLALNAINTHDLEYPLVIKPRWGSASIGIEFIYNENELIQAFRLLSTRLSRTILSEISKSDANKAILIQEKIFGTEYGLDILNDFDGKPVSVFVKEKLSMRAGETDKAVLRKNPLMEEFGFRLGKALGHIGNLDCDVFEKNGNFFLLEMNPRFGGGYPFTHMAGGNIPAAIIAWLNGQQYTINKQNLKYNQAFAKCDILLPVSMY